MRNNSYTQRKLAYNSQVEIIWVQHNYSVTLHKTQKHG